jgi:hypothetical protein
LLVGLVLAATGLQAAPATAAGTVPEQQGSRGVNTFLNYHNASGMGPRIAPGAWVEVSCKVHDGTIASVNPDGYWYRIASAPWNDQYYAPANTFMNGDPWGGPYSHNTDFSVPECGTETRTATPVVRLQQGAVAPQGFYYIVSLEGFGASAAVSISCRDTVSPEGFHSFAIVADDSGRATATQGCYSGDGPDHWVVANGSTESNHVTWTTPAPPRQETESATLPEQIVDPPQDGAGAAIYYSPNDEPNSFPGLTVGSLNMPVRSWSVGRCNPEGAVVTVPEGITTLAGWSLGRLGPIYYLKAASPAAVAKVRTIVLFDPGSTSDFARVGTFRRLYPWKKPCDSQHPVSTLLAAWLNSDGRNRLFIVTGLDSEEKVDGRSTYAGIRRYYLSGIHQQPFAHRAIICDYDRLAHDQVLKEFAGMVLQPPTSCPAGPADHARTQWSP